MYKGALMGALPPHTSRLPRLCPESRLKGATPTRAHRRLWVISPSSGSSASSVLARIGPTPGTLLRSASFSLKVVLASMASSRSPSVRESSFPSHSTCARMRFLSALGAIWRRL